MTCQMCKGDSKDCDFICKGCDRHEKASNICRSCIGKDGLPGVWMYCLTHKCEWCQ